MWLAGWWRPTTNLEVDRPGLFQNPEATLLLTRIVGSHTFPIGNRTGHNPEAAVGFWVLFALRFPSCVIANFQLGKKVPPLMEQLAVRHPRVTTAAATAVDLRGVESVAACAGLVENPRQVTVYGGDGIPECEESFDLRMMPVAAGLSAEDGARQQPLAPQAYKPHAVKMLRMNRPKAHLLLTILLQGAI